MPTKLPRSFQHVTDAVYDDDDSSSKRIADNEYSDAENSEVAEVSERASPIVGGRGGVCGSWTDTEGRTWYGSLVQTCLDGRGRGFYGVPICWGCWERRGNLVGADPVAREEWDAGGDEHRNVVERPCGYELCGNPTTLRIEVDFTGSDVRTATAADEERETSVLPAFERAHARAVADVGAVASGNDADAGRAVDPGGVPCDAPRAGTQGPAGPDDVADRRVEATNFRVIVVGRIGPPDWEWENLATPEPLDLAVDVDADGLPFDDADDLLLELATARLVAIACEVQGFAGCYRSEPDSPMRWREHARIALDRLEATIGACRKVLASKPPPRAA